MTLLWSSNVPPQVEPLSPTRRTYAEGTIVALSTNVLDADGDAPFSATWDFAYQRGDFDVDATTSLAAAGPLQRDHALAQDGRHRVLLRLKDAAGAYVTRLATLDAYNVGPTLSTLRFLPNGTVLPYGIAGQPIRFETTLTDPGADTPWLAAWDLDYDGDFTVDARRATRRRARSRSTARIRQAPTPSRSASSTRAGSRATRPGRSCAP